MLQPSSHPKTVRQCLLEALEQRRYLTISFGAPVSYLPATAGVGVQALAVGDVNGDGIPDLVCVTADDKVNVFPGQAGGTFGSPTTYATGNTPVSVVLADLTGNGRLDIVVANQVDNTIGVLLNAGGGNFQPMVSYNIPTSNQIFGSPGGLAAGQLVTGVDRDDIVDANGDVLLSHPDGSLQLVGNDGVSVGQSGSVAIADMNNDGTSDVVGVSGNIQVAFGNGDGTFKAPVVTPTFGGTLGLAVADFAGNGFNGLAAVSNADDKVYVMRGLGNGQFTSLATLNTDPFPIQLAAADLNNDGHTDLAVATVNQSVIDIFQNNGNGTFTTETPVAAQIGPTTIALADLSGDGYPDLLTGSGSASADDVDVTANSSFATLSGGNLMVTGSSGNDTIALSLDATGNNMTVTMDGQTSLPFPAASVTSIDVQAGAGDDFVTIGPGIIGASVQGGPGNDTILGGQGNDTLAGGQGADSISGGPGDDVIHGGKGADSIGGGKGNDLLYGGPGNDTIRGGQGNDTITGGAGDNVLYGGAGDDTIYANNGQPDTLYGGIGINTAYVDPDNIDQIPNNDIQNVIVQ
jgi:Ca2+-binding RTX toxin-like protein